MGYQVVCRVREVEPGGGLEFTWSVGGSAFPPYCLRDDLATDFQDNAREARDRLFELVQLHLGPAGSRDQMEVRRCCRRMAEAGHNLYNLIFARAAKPEGEAPKVRRWLREITEGHEVQSLEIVSESRPWFAPWNVVYDDDPDRAFPDLATGEASAELPADALLPFWGLRYNLCGGIPVEPLRRKRLPSPRTSCW
jgi:hypothetical protein